MWICASAWQHTLEWFHARPKREFVPLFTVHTKASSVLTCRHFGAELRWCRIPVQENFPPPPQLLGLYWCQVSNVCCKFIQFRLVRTFVFTLNHRLCICLASEQFYICKTEPVKAVVALEGITHKCWSLFVKCKNGKEVRNLSIVCGGNLCLSHNLFKEPF